MLQYTESYNLHHIASFIESERSLKPQDVIRHLKALQDCKRITETPCMVYIDNLGIRVKLRSNEVMEFFSWRGIKNQAAILSPVDCFEFKYLAIYRYIIGGRQVKPCAGSSEVHVFGCESISEAKLFVDCISRKKKDNLIKTIDSDLTSLTKTTSSHSGSVENLGCSVDAIGRQLYLLNRCIDDIENFEKRLSEATEKRPGKLNSGSDSTISWDTEPPSADEFVNVVRKTKYALKLNAALSVSTPTETSEKVFQRLFETIRWFDSVCRTPSGTHYDSDLVASVDEPPLNQQTIDYLMNKLELKDKLFWRTLGPNWNNTNEQWLDRVNSYIPHFDGTRFGDSTAANSIKYNSKKANRRSPSVGSITQSPLNVGYSNSCDFSPHLRVPENIPSHDWKTIKRNVKTTKVQTKARRFEFLGGDRNGRLSLDTTRDSPPSSPPLRSKTRHRSLITDEDADSCMEPVQDAPGKVRKSVVLSAIAYKNKDVRKENTVTWREKHASLDMATRSCVPDSHSPMAIKSDVTLLPQRSQRNSAPCFIQNGVSAGCSAPNVQTPNRESNAEKPCVNLTSNTLPTGEISQKSVTFSSQNDHLGNRASVGNAGLVCITSNELENLFKLSTLQSHIPIALVPASQFSAYMSRASGTATTPNLHTNGDMKRKMTPDDSAKVGLRNTDRTEGDRVAPSIPYCPPVEPPVFKGVKNDENQKNVDDDVASRMQSVTLELRQRLSRMQLTGESGLRTTRSQKCAIEKSDRLGKQSTNEEISQWLRIHNFDPRVISSLKDFNGMDLYTMDRCQLAKYVGSDRCDEVFHAFRSNCKS